MPEYRVVPDWGVTIFREPHPDATEPCTNDGNHPGHEKCAQLVAVVVNGGTALAERICALLNGDDRCWHGEHCPGSGPECERDAPLKGGHRDCAAAWHANHGCATEPFDSCTCTKAGPDPACPVHQGRRARGPKPPPLGPGCICDGSGCTCPRHGAVI